MRRSSLLLFLFVGCTFPEIHFDTDGGGAQGAESPVGGSTSSTGGAGGVAAGAGGSGGDPLAGGGGAGTGGDGGNGPDPCDLDGDTYLNGTEGCEPPTPEELDCNDSNADVHPGYPPNTYFTSPIPGEDPLTIAAWDYDCSGGLSFKYATVECNCLSAGFWLDVPSGVNGCGVTNTYYACGTIPCKTAGMMQTQGCR